MRWALSFFCSRLFSTDRSGILEPWFIWLPNGWFFPIQLELTSTRSSLSSLHPHFQCHIMLCVNYLGRTFSGQTSWNHRTQPFPYNILMAKPGQITLWPP